MPSHLNVLVRTRFPSPGLDAHHRGGISRIQLTRLCRAVGNLVAIAASIGTTARRLPVKNLWLPDRQTRPGRMPVTMIGVHLFGQIATILTCGNPLGRRLVHDLCNAPPSNPRAEKCCATLRTIAAKDT